MLSAAKHLAAPRDRPFASLRVTREQCHAEHSEASRCPARQRDRPFASLRVTREQCHAEHSEASRCPARQTLRFAQGDRVEADLSRPSPIYRPRWLFRNTDEKALFAPTMQTRQNML